MNEKKVHILNIAIELFSKNGFEGTSMRDLAAAADVNIAMINYYFGSKEKLFEAIVDSRSSEARVVLAELAGDKTLSAIQKVERIIEIQVDKVFTFRHFHKVLYNEVMLNKRPELNKAIGLIFRRNSTIIRSIIEEGIKTGEFRKIDIGLVFSTIIGTVNHIFLSRTICNLVFEKDESGIDPIENPKSKKRVIDYLKKLMHVYLLKDSDT